MRDVGNKVCIVVCVFLVAGFCFGQSSGNSSDKSSDKNSRQVLAPHAVGAKSIAMQPAKQSAANGPANYVSRTATGPFWTPVTTAAPASLGAMLLLTNGQVLMHEEPNCSGTNCSGSDFTAWYILTPDINGSYINGTWTQAASLPSEYAPLYFGSVVMPDGTVVIEGGEYNCAGGQCPPEGPWTNQGATYDPVANSWTTVVPPATPTPWANIGDAESVILPDGTYMQADCCGVSLQMQSAPLAATFTESGASWTELNESTKYDEFDEEGWTLLPNGQVLTVDAYTACPSDQTACTAAGDSGSNSELYNPATQTWSSAGSTVVQLWDSNCGAGGGSYEVGPGVLRPDGTVFYTGASDCEPGHTAIFNSATGAWTAGPDFPNKDAANDAPASIETNGNVIVMASPYEGTYVAPSNFYEWNGTKLKPFPAPPNAVNDASFLGHLLVLPTGQIMFTDFTTEVEILTTTGGPKPTWRPTVTSFPKTVTPGQTYTISGTQFNGLTQGAAYGDDFQDATNYPLVRIVNKATGHVFYCKTHNHSSMGVATGSAAVSTMFDVPSDIETGPSHLYVVANGIASNAKNVKVE